jgi:tol-pal system protein YbgF
MKTRTIGIAFLLSGLIAIAAPAAAADKEQRQMMADLRILQEQAQQLQNLVAALSQSLTEAIKSVNQRLDEQAGANRKSFADQKLVIDNAANDLRILREKVDDNSVRVGSLTQELDALRQSVAALNQPRPSAAFGVSEPDSATFTTPDTQTAAPAPVGVGGSPQKLLDGAQADYWGGQYELAIMGFEQYIKAFPNSPQADYAQYYVGVSYFQQGKYQNAIDAFNTVIKNYSRSSFVPDAYVKMGLSYKTLRETDKARQAFEYVIKNFADSVAATIAQQTLPSLPKR